MPTSRAKTSTLSPSSSTRRRAVLYSTFSVAISSRMQAQTVSAARPRYRAPETQPRPPQARGFLRSDAGSDPPARSVAAGRTMPTPIPRRAMYPPAPGRAQIRPAECLPRCRATQRGALGTQGSAGGCPPALARPHLVLARSLAAAGLVAVAPRVVAAVAIARAKRRELGSKHLVLLVG